MEQPVTFEIVKSLSYLIAITSVENTKLRKALEVADKALEDAQSNFPGHVYTDKCDCCLCGAQSEIAGILGEN